MTSMLSLRETRSGPRVNPLSRARLPEGIRGNPPSSAVYQWDHHLTRLLAMTAGGVPGFSSRADRPPAGTELAMTAEVAVRRFRSR
jgi:hypothetical protein